MLVGVKQYLAYYPQVCVLFLLPRPIETPDVKRRFLAPVNAVTRNLMLKLLDEYQNLKIEIFENLVKNNNQSKPRNHVWIFSKTTEPKRLETWLTYISTRKQDNENISSSYSPRNTVYPSHVCNSRSFNSYTAYKTYNYEVNQNQVIP